MTLAPVRADPGHPVELHVHSLPPNVQVTLLGPGDRRTVLESVGPGRVLLPEFQPTLELELSSPGYRPYRVTVRVTEEKSIRLPPEPDRFYRLEPDLTTVTVHSHPPGATVSWVTQASPVVLGRAGEPLSLTLAPRGRRQEIQFRLALPGYREEAVTVTLEQLQKSPVVGPVRLRPLFPGSQLIGWLALHPVVAWVLLPVLLAGMAAVAMRLRRRAGKG
ncbi:MAG: hypothetical protein AB1758_20270 [Candidatus Eremiobacterota bacterium]